MNYFYSPFLMQRYPEASSKYKRIRLRYFFILHDCISIYTVIKHVLIFIAFGLRFCLEIFTT